MRKDLSLKEIEEKQRRWRKVTCKFKRQQARARMAIIT